MTMTLHPHTARIELVIIKQNCGLFVNTPACNRLSKITPQSYTSSSSSPTLTKTSIVADKAGTPPSTATTMTLTVGSLSRSKLRAVVSSPVVRSNRKSPFSLRKSTSGGDDDEDDCRDDVRSRYSISPFRPASASTAATRTTVVPAGWFSAICFRYSTTGNAGRLSLTSSTKTARRATPVSDR